MWEWCNLSLLKAVCPVIFVFMVGCTLGMHSVTSNYAAYREGPLRKVMGGGGKNKTKFDQGKMAGKKILQRETQRKKFHAEEGSHFVIKTVYYSTTLPSGQNGGMHWEAFHYKPLPPFPLYILEKLLH